MAGKALLAVVAILSVSQHLFCVADTDQKMSGPRLCFGYSKPFMNGNDIKQCNSDSDCKTTAEEGICINAVCCPKSVTAKGLCANGGDPKKTKPSKDAPLITCTAENEKTQCGQNYQCEKIRTEKGEMEACCPNSVPIPQSNSMCGGNVSPLLTKDGKNAIACDSFNHSCPHTFYCEKSNSGDKYCCPFAVRTREGQCQQPNFGSTLTCADPCKSDGECKAPRLCCASHCGLKCINPAKHGSCPAVKEGTMGTCQEACSHDDDCTGEKKCCSNGCGHTCQDPHFLVECGDNQMKCKSAENSYKCVPLSAMCNSVKDCYDNMDEMYCKTCSIGQPLPDVSCGRGNPCTKEGYTCKVHPTDQWGICCKAEKKESKFCPLVKPGQSSTCVVGCKSSDECNDGKICCKTACGGAVCRIPLDEAPQKDGLCPMVISKDKTNCDSKQACSIDSNCTGAAKCCRDACGMVCKAPVKNCSNDFREMMVKLQTEPDKCASISIPRCDKTGRYSSMQCEDSTGKCWCVTENNVKIADTEVFGIPDCTAVTKPGLCPKVDTNVHIRCGGYACLNDDGCTGETSKCCYYGCGAKEPPMSSCLKPRAKQQIQACPNGKQPKCCEFNGCVGAVCHADPNVGCRIDPCDNCEPKFFRRHGIEVNCTKDLSDCQKQAYKAVTDRISSLNYTMKTMLYLRTVYNEGLATQRLLSESQRMPETTQTEHEHKDDSDDSAKTQSGKTTPKPSDKDDDDDDHKHDGDVDEDKDPWEEVCKLPQVTGNCKGSFPRYYYNPQTKKCEKFTYGGCNGNKNNFKELNDCEKACLREQARCRGPAYVGVCKAAIPAWFYNSTSKECEKFTYGGCGATIQSNIYMTKQGCVSNCSLEICKDKKCPSGQRCVPTEKKTAECVSTSDVGHMGKQVTECEPDGSYSPVQCDESRHHCWCVDKAGKPKNGTMTVNGHPDCSATSDKDVCKLPKVGGPCEAYMERYFYNRQTKMCEKFIYGGCQGNSNNFKSMAECEKLCVDGTKNPGGVVCPNKEQPKVCDSSKCRDAKCGTKTNVQCKLNPCDNCKVHFEDDTGETVKCEEADTCKKAPPQIQKKSKFGCVNSILKWYYSVSKKVCVAFNYSKGCYGDDVYFQSKESCQDQCQGSACPERADQPQCTTNPCDGETCQYHSKIASCVVDRCTCKGVFKNDYSNKVVNCGKLPSICNKQRANATKVNNINKANNAKEVFVPQCTSDGFYSPVQCDSTDCWCVNPAGKMLKNTKKPVAERENMACVKQRVKTAILRFKSNGDFDIIKGKEKKFRSECLKKLEAKSKEAFKDVKDCRAEKGSIITVIELEAADDSRDVLSSATFLEEEIKEDGVVMDFEGVSLSVDETGTSMALVVEEPEDATEAPPSDKDKGDGNTKTIILAVVCGVLAVALIVGVIAFMMYKKRGSNAGSEVYFSNLENEKTSEGIHGFDNHVYN